MKYSDAIDILIKKQSLGIMPGLARISALLEVMDNPQDKLKIIHIAGTNGKGTVSSSIACTLQSLGYNVGLFSSPWVIDYREQIQINGEFIPEETLAEYIEKYSAYDVTEFEFLTAIAYKYFYDSSVDYAVIECGMGGLLDSTNAIDKSLLSVITSVSLDHTNFLGNTLDEIAEQKAGIIKSHGNVVLYPNPACEHIFEMRCKELNAALYKVNDKNNFMLNNIETIKTAMSVLGFDCDVKIPSLPARQEMIKENIMLDGGHNIDAVKALVSKLPKRNITAVVGMMRDKDVDSYVKNLSPYVTEIITTTPHNDRSMPADELKQIALKYCDNVTSIPNPIEAVKSAKYDFLLVCGSFFLARDVREALFDLI
ncbi:MAG: hypothetical protein J1E36_07580 [Eubacterium sp.]|nr:hypothetical protein [Eubacterium sp.]